MEKLSMKVHARQCTWAERHASRWGVKPNALSSRTLCCVGLVFCIQEWERELFPQKAAMFNKGLNWYQFKNNIQNNDLKELCNLYILLKGKLWCITCSPTTPRTGIRLTWTRQKFSCPEEENENYYDTFISKDTK